MRLLFDENLSRKLVPRLADLFPDSSHAAFEGLLQSPDASVWSYAKSRGFAVVTAGSGSLARGRSKVTERRAASPTRSTTLAPDQPEKPAHDENAEERQIAPEIRN